MGASRATAQPIDELNEQIEWLFELSDHPLEPNDSILVLSDTLERLSKRSDYDLGVLVSRYMQGLVLYRTGEVDSSILVLTGVQTEVEKLSNADELLSRVIYALGVSYHFQGKYEMALDRYQAALTLSERLGDQTKIGTVLCNFGRLYSYMGDLDRAFEYYMQAYSYVDILPSYRLARLYNALGNYYSNKQQLDSSRHYYLLSLEIHQELDDKRGIAHGYNNLAIVDYLSGDTNGAVDGFQSALDVRLELSSPHNISESYYNLGYLNFDLGRHEEAIRNYRLGLVYADKAKSIIAKRDLLLEMSASFEKLRQFDSAYYYLSQGRVLADSVMNEAKQDEILLLEKEYETEKLLARQTVIEKENELTTYQRNALLSGLIIILIAGSVAYYIQQLRYRYTLVKADRDRALLEKETELAQKEIILKQEQIANFTNQLIHKNELLEQLQQQIEQEQLSAKQSASFISQHKTPNLENEHDWLNFKIEFEKAYPGFFNMLLANSPEITPHDQRLASLMRVALSNKEIGHILNISSDSVVKAKYRLRQKLGFESQSQLDQFIQEA